LKTTRALSLLVILLPLVASIGCRSLVNEPVAAYGWPRVYKDIQEYPARQFSYYEFRPDRPIVDRINWKASEVLRYLRDYDSKPQYKIYEPSPVEKKQIERYFKLLPPAYQETVKKYVTGIYFIEDFWGNGLTEWVLGPDKKIYTFVVFDKSTLKQTIPQLLQKRDSTCFHPAPDYRLSIASNSRELGILYMMAHEFTHVLDYVYNITPYVDSSSKFLKQHPLLTDRLMAGTWAEYDKIVPQKFFAEQPKITFYGFRKGPHLSYLQIQQIWPGMAANGLASLYAAQNWAEDLAELASCYILCDYWGYSLRSDLYHKNQKILSWQPQKQKEIRKRIEEFKKTLNKLAEEKA